MSKNMFRVLGVVLLLLCLASEDAQAQGRRSRRKVATKTVSIYDIDTLHHAIPRNRIYIHDKIDKEQRGADVSDGTIDGVVYFSSDDTTVNTILTRALLRDIDHFQVMIENLPASGQDPVMENQTKLRYLTAVWEMMRYYNADTRVDPYFYRRQVNNLRDIIIAHHENKLMPYVKEHINVHTLNNLKFLGENSPEKEFIYTEMSKLEPAMMIRRLSEFANDPAADVAVSGAAREVPQEVYNYASSTNYVLHTAVRRSKDPLVQTIVRISQESKSPLRAMPFLNDIFTRKLTIPEVDKITADQDLFFQNLVRLKVEGVELGGNTYTSELKYRGLKYIREMNDLHDSPDPVRFRCIDNMSPEALYFIMVYGQDEIYTSSFLGTFKRMLVRMSPRTGDQLLDTLHRDRFRTFIRMCAGYNTLDTFLKTMTVDRRTSLMTDFIAGLEKGKEDDLEDAVDVADAFGSISDKELSVFLQNEVKSNYENAYKARSKKGVIVYGLLSTLFEGAKTENEDEVIRQSQLLDLPPINLVQYKSLAGDTGVIFEQFFFYGDDDGKSSYASFLGNFRDKRWKIATSKYWTTITSTSGKPIVIYANNPLPEPQDEEAQTELVKYLNENNIKPTIMVHRGHSYHLPLTMEKLIKESKIVMLGSCGGYHNLGTVLDRSPDAHIISSKQVGAMSVNEPIIKAINDQLLAGDNINWINTWRSLNTYFANKKGQKDLFVDYVPPHKNLGAIFIKAYRKQFHSDEDEEG